MYEANNRVLSISAVVCNVGKLLANLRALSVSIRPGLVIMTQGGMPREGIRCFHRVLYESSPQNRAIEMRE